MKWLMGFYQIPVWLWYLLDIKNLITSEIHYAFNKYKTIVYDVLSLIWSDGYRSNIAL